MTQRNLLELAKQGDPYAIAALMNRSLQPKGIVATVERQGDRLQVLLEATQLPNRGAMTTFVQNGIVSLGIPAIRAVEIQGRQTGTDQSAWQQEVFLGTPTATSKTTAASSPRLAAPPPPPPRPAPPPVPPLRPVPPASTPILPLIVEPEVPEGTLDNPDAAIPNPTAPNSTAPNSMPLPDVEAPMRPIAPQSSSDRTIADLQDADFSEEETLSEGDRLNQPDLRSASAFSEAALSEMEPSEVESFEIEPSEAELTPDAPTRRPSGQPFGVLVVLLVLIGWIGAIIGYALWSALTAPPPVPNPAVSPAATVPPPLPLPTATPSLRSPVSQADLINSYQAALRKGTQAERLAQSAQSVDDWGLVVSQWQQAIDLLQAVPLSSSDRGAAQARLSQYQASLAAARQRAATQPGITNAPPPTTTFTIANDISCPAIASAPGSQPVELTNVQFKRAVAATRDSIVGCITNNTNQAIVNVSVSYQGSSTRNPNLMQSGYSALGFSNLAPRQTVPFRSTFEISPEVTNLSIKSIYWTPPGASTPQQISASIALSR